MKRSSFMCTVITVVFRPKKNDISSIPINKEETLNSFFLESTKNMIYMTSFKAMV